MVGLKIHFISDLNLLDVSEEVILGGHAAQVLGGPAPRQLVHNLMLAGANPLAAAVAVPQGHPGIPPFATRRNQNTQNAVNYVM